MQEESEAVLAESFIAYKARVWI